MRSVQGTSTSTDMSDKTFTYVINQSKQYSTKTMLMMYVLGISYIIIYAMPELIPSD